MLPPREKPGFLGEGPGFAARVQKPGFSGTEVLGMGGPVGYGGAEGVG